MRGISAWPCCGGLVIAGLLLAVRRQFVCIERMSCLPTISHSCNMQLLHISEGICQILSTGK